MNFLKRLFGWGPSRNDQSQFPLILLAGDDPDPEKLFSPAIFDFIGPDVGLFRKDILERTWKLQSSFKAVKLDTRKIWNYPAESSIGTAQLIPLAKNAFGQNCTDDAKWIVVRIVPLHCYLLAIMRDPPLVANATADTGYVDGVFPNGGKFGFLASDFDNEGHYDQFRKSLPSLLQHFRTIGNPVSSDILFEVQFHSGKELDSFMAQLPKLLKECGYSEDDLDRIGGWRRCPHGRYRYDWGGWPDITCSECAQSVEAQ